MYINFVGGRYRCPLDVRWISVGCPLDIRWMSVDWSLTGRWLLVSWPLCVHPRYDIGHSSIDMGHSRYGTRLGNVPYRYWTPVSKRDILDLGHGLVISSIETGMSRFDMGHSRFETGPRFDMGHSRFETGPRFETGLSRYGTQQIY